MISSSQED